MASAPLNPITLYARSYAEEACFAALVDVHHLMQTTPQARLIGGVMVMLHASRWGLAGQSDRLTLDADVGVAPTVIIKGDFLERIVSAGYTQSSGGRYERVMPTLPTDEGQSSPTAMIDLLIPAYTSRARRNVQIGDISTTEVMGLAEALQEPGIKIDALLMGKSGSKSQVQLAIPTETLALALKVMAWNVRLADKDAVDVWRMLEVCRVAKVALSPTIHAEDIGVLKQAFAQEDGQAMIAIQRSARLSVAARRKRWTHIRALLQEVAHGAIM